MVSVAGAGSSTRAMPFSNATVCGEDAPSGPSSAASNVPVKGAPCPSRAAMENANVRPAAASSSAALPATCFVIARLPNASFAFAKYAPTAASEASVPSCTYPSCKLPLWSLPE